MNKNILKILLCALVLISCSDKTSLLDPIIDNPIIPIPNNSVFIKNIYGSWQSGTTKISFDSSQNFIKSWPLTDSPTNTLSMVTQKGKYEIVDSVLILKTNEWLFSNPGAIKGIAIVPVYYEIDFSNGKMIQHQVRVLTKEDNNAKELQGVWKMIYWIYEKETTPKYVEYIGRQEESYNFFSGDSVSCDWNYLDGTPFPTAQWRWKYTYNPPLINIVPPIIENDTVKFKHGKMYWYRKYSESYSRTN